MREDLKILRHLSSSTEFECQSNNSILSHNNEMFFRSNWSFSWQSKLITVYNQHQPSKWCLETWPCSHEFYCSFCNFNSSSEISNVNFICFRGPTKQKPHETCMNNEITFSFVEVLEYLLCLAYINSTFGQKRIKNIKQERKYYNKTG